MRRPSPVPDSATPSGAALAPPTALAAEATAEPTAPPSSCRTASTYHADAPLAPASLARPPATLTLHPAPFTAPNTATPKRPTPGSPVA